MELKEATYKTSELGLIPEDWSITTLSKVGSFSKGKGIKKDEVQTDGIPCVRYGELYTKYDNIITFFHSFISEEVAASSIQIKEGDILFAGSGETREEIGKCAAMLYADRVYAGGDIVVLRPNNFDSTFLGYLLNAPIIAKQKSVKGQGDAVVHIYSSGLANVKIPVPPPEEQKAIATALSDVDALITNLDKLIAKKKAIKQGAMQRLLKSPAQGGQRLPGFEGEWKLKTLDELVFFKNGSAHEQSIAEFGDFIVVNSKFISTEGEIRKYSKEQICPVQEGDILMVMSDVPNGRAIAKCFYVDNSKRYTLNQRICAFTTKGSDSRFLFHLINRNEHFLSYDDGVKQTNLRKDDILSCPLLIPETVEEQNQISTIIDDMIKEIESLETKKSKYLRIKQGMMQELLTGKTRLV